MAKVHILGLVFTFVMETGDKQDYALQLDQRLVSNHVDDLIEIETDQVLRLEDASDSIGIIHSKIPKECIPEIGMEFSSEELAYEFYLSYAKEAGFGIRRSKSHKDEKTKKLLDRTFCCSREGMRDKHKRDMNVKWPRAESRCGCLAKMQVNSRHTGKYQIVKFVAEHNHGMSTPSNSHLLRSHRRKLAMQAGKAELADSFEIGTKEAPAKRGVAAVRPDCAIQSHQSLENNKVDAGDSIDIINSRFPKQPFEKSGIVAVHPDCAIQSHRSSENNHVDDLSVTGTDQVLRIDNVGDSIDVIHSKISKVYIPEAGMEFSSEESAYEFYKSYAKAAGFRVRKSKFHKDDKTQKVLDRTFCCSREGMTENHKPRVNVTSPRADSRCGCSAQMKVNGRHTGKFQVVKFISEHNHGMSTPIISHLHVPHANVSDVEAGDIKNGNIVFGPNSQVGMDPKVMTAVRFKELCELSIHLVSRASVSEEAFSIARNGFLSLQQMVDASFEKSVIEDPTLNASVASHVIDSSATGGKSAENKGEIGMPNKRPKGALEIAARKKNINENAKLPIHDVNSVRSTGEVNMQSPYFPLLPPCNQVFDRNLQPSAAPDYTHFNMNMPMQQNFFLRKNAQVSIQPEIPFGKPSSASVGIPMPSVATQESQIR